MSFICIYSMKIKEFKLYSDKGHITPLNSENLGGGGSFTPTLNLPVMSTPNRPET